MKRAIFLAVVGFVVALFFCLQGCKKDTIVLLIAELEDQNAGLADKAYNDLYSVGKNAIPYLIQNANNKKIFKGKANINPLSSLLSDENTVGVVSLYIIECILSQNLNPHSASIILEENEPLLPTPVKTDDRIVAEAISVYKKWWEANKSIPDIIANDNHPLKGTGLRWY